MYTHKMNLAIHHCVAFGKNILLVIGIRINILYLNANFKPRIYLDLKIPRTVPRERSPALLILELNKSSLAPNCVVFP